MVVVVIVLALPRPPPPLLLLQIFKSCLLKDCSILYYTLVKFLPLNKLARLVGPDAQLVRQSPQNETLLQHSSFCLTSKRKKSGVDYCCRVNIIPRKINFHKRWKSHWALPRAGRTFALPTVQQRESPADPPTWPEKVGAINSSKWTRKVGQKLMQNYMDIYRIIIHDTETFLNKITCFSSSATCRLSSPMLLTSEPKKDASKNAKAGVSCSMWKAPSTQSRTSHFEVTTIVMNNLGPD